MSSSVDFAQPIVTMIEALNSEQRRYILIELEEAGSLSYSEILQRTRLDKGTLNYHLKNLVAAAMVRNFLVDKQVSPYTSYYEVSELGRRFIQGLLNAFRPPIQRIRLKATANYSVDLEIQGEATETKREEALDATNATILTPVQKVVV